MIKKVRVNISVDGKLLKKAKKKLNMFGGKLSTLFNAYLHEFVNSIDSGLEKDKLDLAEKIKKLEKRIEKLEK